MHIRNTSSLFIPFLILGSLAEAIVLTIPTRCRTEGKITLMLPYEDEVVKHQLPFTESIDSIEGRTVVTIGYPSKEASKYYTRQSLQTLTLNSSALCDLVRHPTSFVPELSWFLDAFMPNVNLLEVTSGTNSHLVGPTGLLSMLSKIMASSQFEFDRAVDHRNVPCQVYSKVIDMKTQPLSIKMEIFVPSSGVKFHNLDTTYFTIKATSFDIKEDKKLSKLGVYKASFIIDYFNIDSFDKEPERFKEAESDFNMPMGRGCSEFLQGFTPYIPTQSFSMNYFQMSVAEYNIMSYDHSLGFLRKERPSRSVSIWDLNEELLYHIDTNLMNDLQINVLYPGNIKTCSVLNLNNEMLGPAYRPYKARGDSLKLLDFLGANSLSYIGRGTVRDMPCYIYETIIIEPPMVFSLTEEFLLRNSSLKIDYIVQFFLLQGQKLEPDQQVKLSNSHFWPAKIVLYRRFHGLSLIQKLDQLDVFDFYSSLEGGMKKSSELFMARECFDSDDEQLRIELSLKYKKESDEIVKQEVNEILAYNKFKLEASLINDMISLFQISRMHLIESEMKIRSKHVDLNLVIADRKELKKLVHFGAGTLPEKNSYESNRLVLASQTEESCVLFSSLITDISMVVYCPNFHQELGSCIAVYGENEPVIKNVVNVDALVPSCQVYKYLPAENPMKGSVHVSWDKFALKNHRLEFKATIPKSSIEIKMFGKVKDFDVAHQVHLETIDNYMFAQVQPPSTKNGSVKSFNTFTYNSEGDCAKMCNLDVSCRSYSYCSDGKEHKCYWSDLDIREAKVRDQLIHLTLNEDKQLTVVGVRENSKYNLQLSDHCNIFERNYLNMFRQTDEAVRIERELVHQFQVASSTFDCAKQSVDLELEHPGHHVAMFAYCPSATICLLDENLIQVEPKNESTLLNLDNQDFVDQELVCRVHRKKYQTYFSTSVAIIKQSAENRLEYEFQNVEECARACWHQFGQICSSFDYCMPGSCFINELSIQSKGVELESKQGCLHYERDLKYDDLRKEHSIGRHELFDEQRRLQRNRMSAFGTIMIYSFALCAFFYGLFVGRRMNDKMEAVTILRQSMSGESGATSRNDLFGFKAFVPDGNYVAGEDVIDQNDEMYTRDAIRLDVIKTNANYANVQLEEEE